MRRGDGELRAIPKVAFFVELNERESVVATGHGLMLLGRRLLAWKLFLVNPAGDALQTIWTVRCATGQKDEREGDRDGAQRGVHQASATVCFHFSKSIQSPSLSAFTAFFSALRSARVSPANASLQSPEEQGRAMPHV